MATELFTRWFQYSVFTSPDLRSPQEPWLRPAASQAILTDYVHLRHRLLPYCRSFTAGETGGDRVTALAPPVDFRRYAMTGMAPDSFLFGPALLVSPVIVPGATGRTVQLPSKSAWVDFWTGTACPGGQRIHAPAPLRIIPLFVKAGSILPLAPGLQTTGTGDTAAPLELRVYPGANGRFTIHEYACPGDPRSPPVRRATIPITWHEASRVLKIHPRQETSSSVFPPRGFRIVFVRPRHGVGIRETAFSDQVVTYTGTAVKVRQAACAPPEAAFPGLATRDSALRPRNAAMAPASDPTLSGHRWDRPAPVAAQFSAVRAGRARPLGAPKA